MSKARFCWQHYDFKKLEKVQEVIKNRLKTAETASRERAIAEVWRTFGTIGMGLLNYQLHALPVLTIDQETFV